MKSILVSRQTEEFGLSKLQVATTEPFMENTTLIKCFDRALGSFAIMVCVLCGSAARGGDDTGLLKVRGRGVEGRSAYRGGGVVRFVDVSMPVQVVHYRGDSRLMLPLTVDYEVVETAPICLTSRLGTEYWKLYHFGDETFTAVYTDERTELSHAGRRQTRANEARFGTRYGPMPRPGLVSFRGHYLLLIDPLDDSGYLDVVEPPPLFDSTRIARQLTFTLADLTKYLIAIDRIESTWQPSGPIRIRLVVNDANGQVFPIVNASALATISGHPVKLATQWGPLDEPTGWLIGRLPNEVSERVRVQATIAIQEPQGIHTKTIQREFPWGAGRVSPSEFARVARGYDLPTNGAGVVRETRAIWASTTDISTPSRIDQLVADCRRARLNVVVPDIFVRNQLLAKSDVMPWAAKENADFDPLRDLIAKAHAGGLEVHPWFCVSYRDSQFCQEFARHTGNDIQVIDATGHVVPLVADIHRPAYQDFVARLMIGVARDYAVDGIHLDYIRAKARCYCAACRREFQSEFNKRLTEATDDEWTRWQRQAVGEIVSQTAIGVRKTRPQAKMSAAVFCDMAGGALQGQNPAEWARRGWIDLVLPMDYKMQTLEVRSNERRFLSALDDDSKLVSGLSLYMRSGGQVMSRPAQLVKEQIEEVRRMGIHGYCLFVHERLSPDQLEILTTDVNQSPAIPYFRSTPDE